MKPIYKYFIALVLLTTTNVLYAESKNAIKADKSIVYKKIDNTELKLHFFLPDNYKPSDERPAIIFFFGGGWKSGSATQFYHHSKYLADRGMVAISADYRVKNKNGTSPKEAVSDAKSAMRWLKQHAKSLGINPNKIVAGGGSAGGHLAASTATITKFNDPNDDLTISPMPTALALFNPVYDNSAEGWGYKTVKDYWQDISPLHNLNKNTPPTIVFLGTKDDLVSVKTAEKFKNTMLSLGLRSELYTYEGQKHGFFNYKFKPYYNDTMAKLDTFLVSLGLISKQAN